MPTCVGPEAKSEARGRVAASGPWGSRRAGQGRGPRRPSTWSRRTVAVLRQGGTSGPAWVSAWARAWTASRGAGAAGTSSIAGDRRAAEPDRSGPAMHADARTHPDWTGRAAAPAARPARPCRGQPRTAPPTPCPQPPSPAHALGPTPPAAAPLRGRGPRRRVISRRCTNGATAGSSDWPLQKSRK